MKPSHLGRKFTVCAILIIAATAWGCLTPAPGTSSSASGTTSSTGTGGAFGELPCAMDSSSAGAGGNSPVPMCAPGIGIVEGTLDGQPVSRMWSDIFVSYDVDPMHLPPFTAYMGLSQYSEVDVESDVVVPQGANNPLTKGTLSLWNDDKSPRKVLPGSVCRIDCRAPHIECILNVEGGQVGACAWGK